MAERDRDNERKRDNRKDGKKEAGDRLREGELRD